jgi:hypothetical protein
MLTPQEIIEAIYPNATTKYGMGKAKEIGDVLVAGLTKLGLEIRPIADFVDIKERVCPMCEGEPSEDCGHLICPMCDGSGLAIDTPE